MFLYHDQAPIHFNDPLPEAVDVVVIGGGVIGISTAWFLRERGLSVLVCDKGRVAGEQSSRNWGWVRAMWRDPDEVPIALASINLWERFQAELGEGIGFRRGGILGLAESDEVMAEYEEWMEIARANGMDSRILSSAEVEDTIQAHPGAWKGGIITPSDARAEPFTAVKTLAEGLQAKGGLIREKCAVRTVERQAGRVAAVATEHGRVKTQAVVCAAGAWSNMFLANLGISLPQLAVLATVARTETAPSVFEGAAALGDFYMRRRQDGGYTVTTEMTEHTIGANSLRYAVPFQPSRKRTYYIKLRLGRDVTQPGLLRRKWSGDDESPFEQTRVLNPDPSPQVVQTIKANMAKQVPSLAGTKIVETWGGMIDATPDLVPVMDTVPSHEGVYIATGFSGHGFGIGPGAGQVMARLVTGEAPGHELTRFRFTRFSDGSRMRPGPAL